WQQEYHQFLFQKIGPNGLISGQAREILSDGSKRQIDLEKTAALFECCLALPALATVHSLDSAITQQLIRFAQSYGLYFQMKDDEDDAVQDTSNTSVHKSHEADRVKITQRMKTELQELKFSELKSLISTLHPSLV